MLSIYSLFYIREVDPENEEAVKSIAHFCTASAIFNADKVIVQSENMKKVYMKVLTKIAGEQTQEYWDKKILGIGSPKVDKVLSTQKENLEVSEEWLKIIQKEDGSWKKIIFYNTSVQALLEHSEKMIEKIKDVLKVFKENQDEVVLLWRPHPLMDATIKSVRPWLWEEYQKIVQKYREEGWGIYDDTAELERAVEVSDAYYGDWSSVVQLCQKAGMLIMIQDADVMENYSLVNTIEKLGDCIIVDEENICWYNKDSILFQKGNNENKKTYIWMYTGEYIAACAIEKKIYFAPMSGNKIWILDLNVLKMSDLELPNDSYNNIFNKFYQVRKYYNSLYFLPGKYPYILEYVLGEKKIEKYVLNLQEIGSQVGDLMFFESSHFYKDKIFLASANNGVVCSFDVYKKQINYYHITNNSGFCTICGVENKLYLTDKKGNIIKVIIDGNNTNCIKIFENKESEIRKSIYWNNKIIMFMEFIEECIWIDTDNDNIKRVSLSKMSNYKYNGNKYGEPKLLNNKLYIFNNIKESILVFNEDMEVEEYQINNNYGKLKINYCNENIIIENNNRRLKKFQFYLQFKLHKENFDKDKKRIGKKIYNLV